MAWRRSNCRLTPASAPNAAPTAKPLAIREDKAGATVRNAVACLEVKLVRKPEKVGVPS